MERRTFMGGVATLAAARWNDEGVDIEAVEAWEPLDGGVYHTGRFTPQAVQTSGDGTKAGWSLSDDDFSDRTMEVFYSPDAVNLTFEGTGDPVWGGGLAELTTDQARELAAALFQAAEELDRRSGVTDADE